MQSGKFESRCHVQETENPEMDPRVSSLSKVVQKIGNSSNDLFVSKRTYKVPQYFSLDLSDTKFQGGDALKVE